MIFTGFAGERRIGDEDCSIIVKAMQQTLIRVFFLVPYSLTLCTTLPHLKRKFHKKNHLKLKLKIILISKKTKTVCIKKRNNSNLLL